MWIAHWNYLDLVAVSISLDIIGGFNEEDR